MDKQVDTKLPPGLQEIFDSRSMLESFHDFTANLFCEENLLFLEDVIQMKRSGSASQLQPIFSKYIKEASPLQVNVDGSLQAPIASKFERGAKPEDLTVFDGAFHHVAALVEQDSVRKFFERRAAG